jgi:hypothetical protein
LRRFVAAVVLMESLYLSMSGLALLGAGSGMVAMEAVAVKAKRNFFRSSYSRDFYWMIYLSAFVLGTTFLLKAAIG